MAALGGAAQDETRRLVKLEAELRDAREELAALQEQLARQVRWRAPCPPGPTAIAR